MRRVAIGGFRALGALFGVTVLLVLTFFATTIVGALIPSLPPAEPVSGKSERVFLLANALHADFAVPVDDALRRRFSFLRETGIPIDNPALKFLVFGWGSRAFYTNTPQWSDLRPGPVWRAITGDTSVLHVVPVGDIGRLPQALALSLPPGGMERLASFIAASFDRDRGRVRALDHPGYGLSDVFFEARGGFSILNPCNIWIADGLRVAGIATGAWTPTTQSLKLGLSLHAPEALRQ